MTAPTVKCYFLPRNGNVPNSKLPVLHYQHVLPEPLTEDVVTKFLEANQWEKRVSLANRAQSFIVVIRVRGAKMTRACNIGNLGPYPNPPLPPEQP